MTANDLQSEYETQKSAGRYIIYLQAGAGNNANFAALWAEQDIPTPRSWRAQLEPSPDFKTMRLQGHKLTHSWRTG
jgi:hypothetical protein